uniref:Remorin C-terminal domain-containing protein n=1 Tax=Fagus sylvatica TaxID=28930 RepID=A0A2N9GQ27_FAGSY
MEKEVKKVEAKTPETPTLASSEVPNDVAQEKPAVHPQETKADESKAIHLSRENGVLGHSFTHLKLGGVNGFINTDNDGSFKFQQDQSCYPKFHKTPEPVVKKASKGSIDRDVALAELEKEKSLSFIKAWEESEKSKAENKAQKKLSDVAAWENSQKAAVEAKLRKIEEQLEKKKADYAEKMKNKAALIHKQAEEKRAMVEARRGEERLKAEETAAKYRATGHAPKKLLGCF